MDVDGDVDSQLLQQFSSMATTDREVLIAEFQRLLGNRLSDAGCAFFLDMNNWNLQAAICSYFEYDQPVLKVPQMSFVKDVTIGEGESVTPNTKFTKTWRLQNSGDESWPFGCSLRFVSGEQFGPHGSVSVDMLKPGEMTDVSIEMTSPSETGIHQGQWRMSTAAGLYFGELIWVILQVEEGGVLAVTQLLSNFSADIAPAASMPVDNPFISPAAAAVLSSHVPVSETVISYNLPPTNCTTDNMPRHSSLPSSPRWFGESTSASTSPMLIPNEPLRARAVLFQTPDNSPSRTIHGARTTASISQPATLPSGLDTDTMET